MLQQTRPKLRIFSSSGWTRLGYYAFAGAMVAVVGSCVLESAAPPKPLPASRSLPLRARSSEPARLDARPSSSPARAKIVHAEPSYPFQQPLLEAPRPRGIPAMRFAKLSPGQCRAELKKRKIVTRAGGLPAQGIATPVRLSEPLRGVQYVAPGKRSPYGMLDCRLVLALDELAGVLERYGVVRVQVDNLYRPRAHLPGKRKESQHAHGLAVDVRALELEDGRVLLVERDWYGSLTAPPCGPGSAVSSAADEAILLRNAVCDIAREGIFHHILTPNHDEAHHNHVHMDIARDASGVIIR